MAKKKYVYKLANRVTYIDSTTETICGDCEFIKRRFKDFIHAAVETRLDGFYKIELLDYFDKPIKIYVQNI